MGFRKLVVDGVDYRWTVTNDLQVAVRDPEGKTHVLKTGHEKIGDNPAITPRHVVKAIREHVRHQHDNK